MFSLFNPTLLLTYDFLVLCVIASLFVSNTRIKIGILIFTIAVAYAIGSISLLSFIPIMGLSLSCYVYYRKGKLSKSLQATAYIVTLIISLGLLLHKIPGFNNVKIIDNINITSSSAPFSMWLNFDKPVVAIIILLLSGYSLTFKDRDWNRLIKVALLSGVSCIAVLIIPVLLTDIINYDPKLPNITPIWIINMLFFVCFAEEVLFRYFIQGNLGKILKFKYGQYVSIVITSILFGLVHLPIGGIFAVFAFITGLAYGYSYYKTKSIEAAILTHFTVNFIHFTIFTYPVAQS